MTKKPLAQPVNPPTSSGRPPVPQPAQPADVGQRGEGSLPAPASFAAPPAAWWPFEESEDAVPAERPRALAVATSSGRLRRSVRGLFQKRDWQRAADVLLVGALVVTIGVSAKTVMDRSSSQTEETAPAQPDDRREGDEAEPLTGGASQSQVTHRVKTDGSLVVEQRLLTKDATSRMVLSNGEGPLTTAGEDGARVRDLSVTVDGRPVELTQTTLEEGQSAEVVLGGTAREFLLRYVVEDAVATSGQSVPGRALVELRTVRTDEATAPQVVRVRAEKTGEVLSLACGTGLADATPCGREGPELWTVPPADVDPDAAVFASVDLPVG